MHNSLYEFSTLSYFWDCDRCRENASQMHRWWWVVNGLHGVRIEQYIRPLFPK